MRPVADYLSATWRARLWLLPFAALVLVYFYLYNPWLHLPPETLVAASFKAAPIWYLAHYVGMARDFRSNGVAVGTRVGLVLSSFGDVWLAWSFKLFVPGVIWFALAHITYSQGLRSWLKTYRSEGGHFLEFILAGAFASLFIVIGMDSWVKAGVMAYAFLLVRMVCYAVHRHLAERSEGSLAGALGGICFAASDLLIAVDKWKVPVPGAEGLIMTTYYAAQVAIAYGAATSCWPDGGERRERVTNKGEVNGEDGKLKGPAKRSAYLYSE